jgi:hypothetical protein
LSQTPAALPTVGRRGKLKVSDNEHSHGSLFLRAGAKAFIISLFIFSITTLL